jgi:hypothetical protein
MGVGVEPVAAMNMTRSDMLANLADDIRELTQQRTHTEYRETTKTDGQKRTRVRQPHTITMPSLLQSLQAALEPGTTGELIGTANFESRPSADLEPLRVWTMIRNETLTWCNELKIERDTLAACLSGLVSAHHTDNQLTQITTAATRWVKQAKLATGWDPEPITLNQHCPYCWAKNQITVTGDLQHARCARCRTEWTHDTIGLLGQMLTTNTQPTVTTHPCPWDNCYRAGQHDVHWTRDGKTWRDTCDLTCA